MSELLQVKDTDKVWRSHRIGYQAAILSVLAQEVYSIEIVPELGEAARNVSETGLRQCRSQDRRWLSGWQSTRPLMPSSSLRPRSRSPALIEQLKPSGRMVIPVGGYTRT